MKNLKHILFNEQTGPKTLFFVSCVLLFLTLGCKPLWTMENRWASIMMNMLALKDYLHPYLAQRDYYDKPLLSYWLVLPFVKLFGINMWSLRLPSALAGGLSLWSVYQLAKHFWNKQAALYAGWMLLTSLGFLFWSHVASADMLNIAGSMFALLIYQKSKAAPTFKSYLAFFIILFLTALCKGVVVIACLGLVLLPDLIYQNQWKKHLSIKLLIGLLIGLGVYLTPFWLSSHYNTASYQESGLVEVFRENFLRFFAPFDHEGKWFIYFYFFPAYLFPWIFFFIPALLSSWRGKDWNQRWMLISTILLFIFFCISQSRRSYYILPLIPFAVLAISGWLQDKASWKKTACITTKIFVIIMLLGYIILIPAYYFSDGQKQFGAEIKAAAEKISPWPQWKIIILHADVEDVMFMQSKSRVYVYDGDQEILPQLALIKDNRNTIYVMPKKVYMKYQNYFEGGVVITVKPWLGEQLLGHGEDNPSMAVLKP